MFAHDRCEKKYQNIKWILRETRWDGMDLIDVAQDRNQWVATVNTAKNLWVP
jgi:hypothetical protein